MSVSRMELEVRLIEVAHLPIATPGVGMQVTPKQSKLWIALAKDRIADRLQAIMFVCHFDAEYTRSCNAGPPDNGYAFVAGVKSQGF